MIRGFHRYLYGCSGQRSVAFLLLAAVAFTGLFAGQAVRAAVDVYEFETAEQEQRFRQLSNNFRCPMCQNANLTSSPGGVAEDLRREIYRMIMEGRSDEQIEQFMLERYGDFILYRPRLTLQTVLLWFGPLLFLLGGAWVALNIARRSGASTSPQAAQLSEAEQQRLNRLLNDHVSDHEKTDQS